MDQLEIMGKLERAYTKLKIAKELYETLLAQEPKSASGLRKQRTKVRYAREEILKMTLETKKMLKYLEKKYNK